MFEPNSPQIIQSLYEIGQAIVGLKEPTSYVKEYLGPVLQVVSTFVAAGLVIWQVGRQHRNDAHLQRENIKAEMKRKLHEEIEIELGAMTTASVKGALWNKLNYQFVMQQAQIAQSLPVGALSIRIEEVVATHFDLASCVARVIGVIEKYEIVEPKIKIFQTALNVREYDMRHAWVDLSSVLFNVLPQNSSDGKTTIYKPLASTQLVEKIRSLAETYDNAVFNIGSIIYDFRVEIQNLLLGDLFERKVPKRRPLDPNEIVISTDMEGMKELSKYFEEETPWGKNKQKIEAEVKKKFLEQPKNPPIE